MPTKHASQVHHTLKKAMALGNDQSENDDLKLAEQALMREKEFSRCLLDSMADGVVACDADGILTLFNRSAREWHGLDPMKLPSEEWSQHYDLFRTDGITPLTTDEIPLTRAFRGEIVSDAVMAIKAKGQAIRFILANGSVILDETGRKLGAVVIMHNVTEFRRLELELRKANEELEQRVEERTEAVRMRERMLNESQRVGQVGGWDWDAVNDVIWWSDEYYRIYGFEPGTPPNYLEHLRAYTPESAERLGAAVKRAMESGEPYELDLELVNPTPATRWIVARCEVKRDENGAIVGLRGTAHNITERKLAEEGLHRLNRELRAISDCNQVLVRADDEQTLLGEICRIVCDKAGYRMAWVGHAEHDKAKSVLPAAWAGVEGGYLAQARLTWADTERGRGPAGTAIRSGSTDCSQDIATDPRMTPWRDNALQRGYRSTIALPLKDENANVFGVFLIYSSEPNAFTPDEIRLLEELAGDLAFGIQALRNRNARRESERSIALLSFALDNVHEAAFLIDEQARFHYVNEESCRVLGYTRDELLGMGVADVDPDFPVERWPEHWAELKNRHSLTFESCHKARDGRIFPVELSANYLEYDGQDYNLALARDITERKRAAEALHLQTVELEEEVAERQTAQENLQEKALLLEEEIEKGQKTQAELEQLNKSLELRVSERTAEVVAKSDELEQKNRELERFNKLFVNRELKMVELKERIRELENSSGENGGHDAR